MFTNDYFMPQKNNSEIIKQVLNTLINTVRRKGGEKRAISMLSSLLKELESEYVFLQYVEVQDIRLLEEKERVIVMPNINAVLPTEVGKVLHIIILKLSLILEDKDGYFLIREFQQRIGNEYSAIIKTIGIDTELLLLEYYLEQDCFKF